MILLLFILTFVFAVSEAVMDTLAHHFGKSIFAKLNPKFWNPVLSGGNKWKNGDSSQGERFLFSSSIFVFVTEGWHLFKMIRTSSIFGMVAVFDYDCHGNIWFTLLARVLFGLLFTVWYSDVLKED